MGSYEIFKLLHLFGIMMVFASFGGILGKGENRTQINKFVGILHGVGLIFVLLFGFALHGSLAKAQVISGMPGFIILKLVIWLVLGFLPVLPKKEKLSPTVTILIALVLGLISAWLGLAKPF